MKYEVEIDGLNKIVDIVKREKTYVITMDEIEFVVSKKELSNSIHMLLDEKSYEVGVAKLGETWEIGIEGERFVLPVIDPRKKSLRLASGEGEGLLISKMPGRVVDVCCTVGQTVEKGDVIIIVEAMKMENPLKAARAGTISEIFVASGDLVEAKQKLILIE